MDLRLINGDDPTAQSHEAEDRGCRLPGGQSVQEQSPGESPSSTPVPAEAAFPGSRMRTFKKPYGGVGSSYLRVRYARFSSEKSDRVDQNVPGFGL